MKRNRWILALAALLAAVTAGGCAASAGVGAAVPTPAPAVVTKTPAPSPSAAPQVLSSHWDGYQKYTQADYSLAMSFLVDGWEDMSVADFNARLLNVADEEAFHKVDVPLRRVTCTLPSDDPNAPFILGALSTSLSECRVKHYNACIYDQLPQWSGSLQYERYEDVFGDKVTTAVAYGDYWFRYSIADESAVTVKERESFLSSIDKGMENFFAARTEADFADRDSMCKALKTELERLAAQYGGTKIAALDCDAGCEWNNFY